MSQPGPPAPTNTSDQSDPSASLDQAEQQRLIQEIGRLIVRALPPGWHETHVEYRSLGAHDEVSALLIAPNGTHVPLAAPVDVKHLFDRLRRGMYQPERGTWVSALYRLQRPGSYTVDFNGDSEPTWLTAPPTQAYADELRAFPRPLDSTPEWLARNTASTAERAPAPMPSAPVGPLRTAEMFDESGHPIIDRPKLDPTEREQLLAYLDNAPTVVAARGFDTDRLAAGQGMVVPLTFHTDGTWVWPGAVNYYLRQHHIAPDSELIAHARQQGYRLPTIDEDTRERAVGMITGARAR